MHRSENNLANLDFEYEKYTICKRFINNYLTEKKIDLIK